MDPRNDLRATLEGVVRELDDNALVTLERAGIKGKPQDPCLCPVAKYVTMRMEYRCDTATTGVDLLVHVYPDSVEVVLYRPDGTLLDTALVRDVNADMGAFAFVAAFGCRASWRPYLNRYLALIG